MLPVTVAQSSSGMLTIGCIAIRQEGVTGVHSAGEVLSTIALNIIVDSLTYSGNGVGRISEVTPYVGTA